MIRFVSRALAVGTLGGVLFAVPFSTAPTTESQDSVLDNQIRQELELFRYDLVDLEISEAASGPQSVSLNLDGLTYTFDLIPHSLRADDFQLLVQGEDGEIREVEAPESLIYKGSVREFPDSRVAAQIKDGQLSALTMFEDGSTLTIEPLSQVSDDASPQEHVAYWGTDVRPNSDWTCGLDQLGQNVPSNSGNDSMGGQGGGIGSQGTGLRICDIAFDADVEFYNRNNSSVEDTMYDIEWIMVGCELIYERDCDITYEVTVILVRTSEPDPYSSTDAGTLLVQFQNHWNGQQSAIRRDVAHLMTGKNLNGSTIGVAYLSVICNRPNAYGLSQSRFSGQYNSRVALTAHELGHNWSANHCNGNGDCHIMCSGLGGCNGLGLPNFGVPSANRISNYADGRSCLGDLGPPLTFPFFEDWEAGLDLDIWSYNKGGSRNQNGENEPSGIWSINLDAAGNNANQDDDLRSNEILLGGVPLANLSYWLEHRGVEAGKTMRVYYWNNDLAWVLLNTVVSDGTNQDNFVQYTHTLPPDALHDEFRVRFTPDVGANNDEWYLDDIAVDLGDCDFPVHYGNATPGGGGITPTIAADGLPSIGQSFDLVGDNMYGAQSGFLFTGFSASTSQLANGIWLNTLPPWFITPIQTGGLPLPGQGDVTVTIPLPNDPALIDLHLYFFMLMMDPSAGNGWGGTDGLDITICE